MTEFEKILDQCLRDLEQGAANVDECLSRHPNHALQLEPILLTAEYLVHGREARPSRAFKSRVRSKVLQGLNAHPHKGMQFNFIFIRFAASLAAIVLALAVAGTAYAQRALPGEAFYSWKRASENAWRAVSPDPVATDLAIAGRRVDELITVSNDPARHSQALDAYLEVVARLQAELEGGNNARILQALDAQTEELNRSGILLPQPEKPNQEVLPPFLESTPTPIATPTSSNPIPLNPTAIPSLLPEIPQVNPTDLPNVLPTIEVPLELIPTVQIPPLLP